MNKILGGIFGLCAGDALGVPVEFKSREFLKNNPVKDMTGYGTYNEPSGTWSDDSSLTLCLAQSLCSGYNLNDIAEKFIQWYKGKIWTPHGKVFDIGIRTRDSIVMLMKGYSPEHSGGKDEFDNSNGSLMRILPLIFYLKNFSMEEKFFIVKQVSSITHSHIRTVIACLIYVEFGINLLNTRLLEESYDNARTAIKKFFQDEPETDKYFRILNNDISKYPEKEIKTSGYVVDTLEASLWCLLSSRTYEETVLKAVNLGNDTDTTGAIAGGLAGIYYGMENIPEKWINALAKKEEIKALCIKLQEKLKV